MYQNYYKHFCHLASQGLCRPLLRGHDKNQYDQTRPPLGNRVSVRRILQDFRISRRLCRILASLFTCYFVNETFIYLFNAFCLYHYFLRGLDKDTPERTCRIILSPFDDGIGQGQKPVYGHFPYTPLLLMNTSLADTLNESSISEMLILKCLYYL